MGGNPSYRRWGVDQWRTRAPTAGLLQEANWSVFTACNRCGLQMTVRLAVVIRAKGPDFNLWGGKTVRCRRRNCQGLMRFYVQTSHSDLPFWME